MTEMTFEDLKKAGFNVEEGFQYTGDSEKFLATLQRFYRRSGKNLTVIKDSLANGDHEVLIITVHALKSNARMIGADGLAELAEKMELSGKDGDIEGMLGLSDELLDSFNWVVEQIKPYGLMEAVHPASEISAEEAEKTGSALIEAVEDFDDEKAIELIDTLMRYPFRFTLINVLKNARQDIEDFEYTGALLKIRRVISQIED